MKEYNLLTQELLKQGYTVKNFPDYVQINTSKLPGDDPLHNIVGGFEYTSDYLNKMVFKTGCGLHVKGSHFLTGHLCYMGITWLPENNNPVITCPYRKDDCDLKNPILGAAYGGGLVKIMNCDCHRTEEPYEYEYSVDKIHDDEQKEIKHRYEEFSKRFKGHVCHWHMHYDYWSEKWKQRYDPMTCARYCQNTGGICSLTHKPISKSRGNVFYDVKITSIRRDGTLFDGEKSVFITKGERLFETAKSLTICEQAAKKCRNVIWQRVQDKYKTETLLYGTEVEVLNIRAEKRESRDLMQDLEDIKNGIHISHASDIKKREKQEKHERRIQAQEKRIQKLEKKILEVGYDSLEEYSLDRVHADKWLGEERIAELEEIRQKNLQKEQNEAEQISLFDFM